MDDPDREIVASGGLRTGGVLRGLLEDFPCKRADLHGNGSVGGLHLPVMAVEDRAVHPLMADSEGGRVAEDQGDEMLCLLYTSDAADE